MSSSCGSPFQVRAAFRTGRLVRLHDRAASPTSSGFSSAESQLFEERGQLISGIGGRRRRRVLAATESGAHRALLLNGQGSRRRVLAKLGAVRLEVASADRTSEKDGRAAPTIASNERSPRSISSASQLVRCVTTCERTPDDVCQFSEPFRRPMPMCVLCGTVNIRRRFPDLSLAGCTYVACTRGRIRKDVRAYVCPLGTPRSRDHVRCTDLRGRAGYVAVVYVCEQPVNGC